MATLTLLTRSQVKDRIRGCLFGCAVGDAYGLATEFMNTQTAVQLYGNGPIAFGREPGYPVWIDGHRSLEERNDFTDDTDQMLLLLQSLEHTRDGRLHPIQFARRLREWKDHGIPEIGTDPARGLGYTVGRVLDHPDFEFNPHRAAFDIWDSEGRHLAPNGAVMRTAVIGIESFWDERQVVENALAAAKVTHADPRSILSALVSSVLISRLLRGGGCDAARDSVQSWNPALAHPTYRLDLLTYLERGSDLKGEQSYNPPYEPPTPANAFHPKDYNTLKVRRMAEEANADEPSLSQLRDQDPSEANTGRSQVQLRSSIGWAGIDSVGEDEAVGALARAVVQDYLFLIQDTDLVPEPSADRLHQRVQDLWVQELQSHCFPQNLGQLGLGDNHKIGYALKCIGIGVYGATRRVDPHPAAPEYAGSSGLFRGLMEQVTLQGGDADTNDAVMGSLLGARFGLENGIPAGWWQELRHLQWLDATFEKYAERVLSGYDARQ
ncbi:hypothetical protein EDD11_007207 [Mortierella claussenii]|nr:hypothetical protein EDD11_007207 [Mortierella claussenii]